MHQPPHRREAQDQREVRLRRRGRRRTAAAAEVGHQGGQGLRRLPRRRRVPAHRQSAPWPPRTRPRCTASRRWAAPPMSVPHLDTRVINGRSWLLFGPFAGWSPKFLKQGKVTDLPFSVKPNNLGSMLGVGLTEMSLVKYLISQLRAQRGRPGRRAARVRAQRSRLRLGARRRGSARPGDPPQGRRRRARVRHHGARGGRRQHRRSARRLAGRVDGGARHARRDGALLRRPLPGVAAQAQGDGAVARHRAVQRAQALRRSVGAGAPRCSSSTRLPRLARVR